MLILCLARYSSLPFSDVDAGLQAYASHAHFSCPPFLAAWAEPKSKPQKHTNIKKGIKYDRTCQHHVWKHQSDGLKKWCCNKA